MPGNIFDPASWPAREILELSKLVLAVTGAIFVVVTTLLVVTVVRFRARPGDDGREPAQVYGSDAIELAWTIVPVMIVVVLLLVSTRSIIAIETREPTASSLRVKVIGHQWWWELRYPDLGVVSANELHLPVSTNDLPAPAFLTLQSADVVHSFWVPRLAGKTDLIPNHTNTMWVEPTETGVFLGQCAEYCGTQHARMLLRVVVHERADFDRWVAAQREPSTPDVAVARGRELFADTSCVSCHTVRGTSAAGTFGPDLTHLMSRETLGAGATANTPEHLRTWIHNPQRIKPGVLMPDMQLTDDEVEQMAQYLASLR